MDKVNPCLKRTFTIFNVFFAVVGVAIIGLALLSQNVTNVNGEDDLQGRTTGLIILYVVGIVTMGIAILGAYGAHKENRVALIVFLVCMVIGSLLMLRAGVPFAIARPRVEGILEDKFRELLPLDTASGYVKDKADTLQTQLHCCGLFSYEDWQQNIPDSCLCDQEEQLEGQCQPVSDRLNMTPGKSVHVKTCFPILLHYTMLLVDIIIGVVFTLAALALLGMILSFIIIYQMRYPDRPTKLLPAHTIFISAKYEELLNSPKY
ncbi:hypothetical protein PAMP_015302 [Pampus punctatissimus]